MASHWLDGISGALLSSTLSRAFSRTTVERSCNAPRSTNSGLWSSALGNPAPGGIRR
jgi:hypothetical protein